MLPGVSAFSEVVQWRVAAPMHEALKKELSA
jgi:hypothetical protein